MKKVAIVVQRCHESIVGGSETLAWQYATLLNHEFPVDVITTTALDYTTWANILPSGCEEKQGINIYRFPVSIARSDYWHKLHERLLREFHSCKDSQTENNKRIPWSIALQEEFICRQGPYSESMLSFLGERACDYEAIIFTTYLYPTTYFGISQVPLSKVILVPTLHDEPPAYLSAYRHTYQKVRFFIWLTHAEKVLGEKLWGEVAGSVVSMGVDTLPHTPYKTDYPYLLYCGRIDSSKGCNELINFFIRFKENYPSDLRLILTGKDEMGVPSHPGIEFRGFVSLEEKYQLMAGATVFVLPSPYESFSIVTLEAMAQKTPVLVNGSCQVLVEHITRSRGGYCYHNYEDFTQFLQKMIADRNKATEMGDLARQYVVSNYAFETVQKNLIAIINNF